MKKKGKRPINPQSIGASLEQIKQAFIAADFMFPAQPEHLNDEDLALIGKGTPKDLSQLESASRSRDRLLVAVSKDSDVHKSLAMAARNGQQISEDVRNRMRADRVAAESSRKNNE